MARKKAPTQSAFGVSLERSERLFRLLNLLGAGPQTRASLTRKLRLGVRGFYRDLEVLRAVDIEVELDKGKYQLKDEPVQAIERLPFPDPGLNLGEARQLSKGRSRAHKKIREMLSRIES